MSNLQLKADITNYTQADAYIGKRAEKPLGYATTIHRVDENQISVRHHGNVIARFYSEGRAWYSNAGWGSSTTRNRLTMLSRSGVSFGQKAHAQYVTVDGETTLFDGEIWIAA